MSKGYRNYKPNLRIEFSHRCAYCETREPEIGGAKSFHIDHYQPKNRFPELINSYDNLIYSYRDCNGYKKDYWPNTLERLFGKIIVNPRKDKIQEHINTINFAWSGITSQGKWTVERLRLNSLVLIKRRDDRMRIENKIQQLTSIIEDAKVKLKISTNLLFSERQKLEKFIDDETRFIDSLKRKIFGPMD